MSKTDPHCRYCDSTDLYACEICHEERMLHYQTIIEDLKWDLEHATLWRRLVARVKYWRKMRRLK